MQAEKGRRCLCSCRRGRREWAGGHGWGPESVLAPPPPQARLSVAASVCAAGLFSYYSSEESPPTPLLKLVCPVSSCLSTPPSPPHPWAPCQKLVGGAAPLCRQPRVRAADTLAYDSSISRISEADFTRTHAQLGSEKLVGPSLYLLGQVGWELPCSVS